MTLKEFIEKNPFAVEEALKCKNFEEFKALTEKAGITFDTQEKLKKAFELIKIQNVNELDEDELGAVSGGGRKVKSCDVYKNDETGKIYSTSKGKKV